VEQPNWLHVPRDDEDLIDPNDLDPSDQYTRNKYDDFVDRFDGGAARAGILPNRNVSANRVLELE
jgi:hypothetical protein